MTWEPSGNECPTCGKTTIEGTGYERCLSCVPNEKLARDSTGGPTARQREIQLEIEQAIIEEGEVRLEF